VKGESAEAIACDVERQLNEIGMLYTETHMTRVGVRVHVEEVEVTK